MSALAGIWRIILRLIVFSDTPASVNSEGMLLRDEAIRKHRRATRKSLTLLLKLLTPEQRREFRRHRCFYVVGGSSGDVYRIRVGKIANVDLLGGGGKVKYSLCVHPDGGVPIYDAMAAQVLHLQDPLTEERFLQRANICAAFP
jgi:hypothetical protein